MGRFRIQQDSRIGYEYVSGETTKEFVEYWSKKSEQELNSHIWKTEIDKNSPPIIDDYFVDDDFNWWEMSDIEHISQFDFSGKLEFVEIDDNGMEIGHSQNFRPEIVYVRNGCFQQVCVDNPLEYWVEDKLDNYFPVFSFLSVEKGCWSEWVIDCDREDFNRQGVFSVGILRLHGCDMIERLFYNHDEIEEDFDTQKNSDGRWSRSSVGWSWKKFSSYYDLKHLSLSLRPNSDGVLVPQIQQ